MNRQLIIDFATEKHKGQKRKDGKDYITHPIAVAEIAERIAHAENSFTEKEIEMIVAISYLHDGLEDTDMTEDQIDDVLISAGFIDSELIRIVNAIYDLTRLSKRSSIIHYLEGIKGNRYAKIVKLADLEHNLSDLEPGNLRDKYHLCQYYLNNN